jgi:hypothetical protein
MSLSLVISSILFILRILITVYEFQLHHSDLVVILRGPNRNFLFSWLAFHSLITHRPGRGLERCRTNRGIPIEFNHAIIPGSASKKETLSDRMMTNPTKQIQRPTPLNAPPPKVFLLVIMGITAQAVVVVESSLITRSSLYNSDTMTHENTKSEGKGACCRNPVVGERKIARADLSGNCCQRCSKQGNRPDERKVPRLWIVLIVVDDGRPQPFTTNFRCACGTFRGCCWGTCYPGCKCPGI